MKDKNLILKVDVHVYDCGVERLNFCKPRLGSAFG